jgi:hypothetical protein
MRDVLKRAMDIAIAQRPTASPQKRAAFANSVVYLVTGMSGGYGGPSVREHAASHLYGDRVERCSFEEACKLLLADDGPIFGPLTALHQQCWEDEECFDDDPTDVRVLKGVA